MNKRNFYLMLFIFIVTICNISIVYARDLTDSGWSKLQSEFLFGTKRRVSEFPSDLPYSAVTYIDGGYGICSGFMIGPHYAVTAARCIYSKTDGFSKSVMVVPGSFGQNAKCGPTDANYLYIMDTELQEKYNIAVLQIAEDIGNCSGWFGYKQITSSEAYGQARIIGYDKSQMQFETTGYLHGFADYGNFIQHDMDTRHENPGAPLFVDGNYVIGMDVSFNYSYNLAIRFTDEVVNFLKPYWGK